jgi:hypothetical protein
MKLNGIKKSFVEIEYFGTYSELIDEIFKDIFNCSFKNMDNIIIEKDIIKIQIDESYHGSPMYKTIKEIRKNDDEELFYLANNLYLVYTDLLSFKKRK